MVTFRNNIAKNRLYNIYLKSFVRNEDVSLVNSTVGGTKKIRLIKVLDTTLT